jgi:hypothetical protein
MRYVAAVAAFGLAGCSLMPPAAEFSYSPPGVIVAAPNAKVLPAPRDAVWSAAVPAVGKQFYVINNLDRVSGLMNLSFSGSPSEYIDCGIASGSVTGPGLAGVNDKTAFWFAAASSQERYVTYSPNDGRVDVDRKLSLDGRVNLIFEDVTPASTRVTANVRYTVTRTLSIRPLGVSYPQTVTHTIGFNSGGGDAFPATFDGNAIRCVPTGKLEQHILSLIGGG